MENKEQELESVVVFSDGSTMGFPTAEEADEWVYSKEAEKFSVVNIRYDIPKRL